LDDACSRYSEGRRVPVNGTTINAAIIVKVTNPDDFIIVIIPYVENGLLPYL
jgi:hypothetical protein